MVSAKTILLMAALVGLCVANRPSRQTSKCQFPPGYDEKATTAMLECYEEVTGKPFDVLTFDEKDKTEENAFKLKICLGQKFGFISQDGQTFMLDGMNEYIDSTIANDIIKTQIKEAAEDCVAKGGDVLTISGCATEATLNICIDP